MDYEKKYKEALEKVKGLLKDQEMALHAREKLANVFPELKENEYEKNIKDLIEELKLSLRAANCQNEACNGGHEKRIALLEWAITWLEKQAQIKESIISQHEIEMCKENDNSLTSEDERIKETLKEFVKGYSAFINGQWRLGDFTVNRLIAWLEKKGEHRPLDAYKVIEWINNQACLGFIEDVEVEKFVEKFKKDFGL